jgi:hypothetical protein
MGDRCPAAVRRNGNIQPGSNPTAGSVRDVRSGVLERIRPLPLVEVPTDFFMLAQIRRAVGPHFVHVRNRYHPEAIDDTRMQQRMRIEITQLLPPGEPFSREPAKPSRLEVKHAQSLVVLQPAAVR